MAVRKCQIFDANFDGVTYNINYYIADTESELPAGGLNIGDLARASDTGYMYCAINSSQWNRIIKGAQTGGAVTLGPSGILHYDGSLGRSWEFPPLKGSVPIIGDEDGGLASGELGLVDLTNQSAAIAAWSLTNTTPADYYLIFYTLAVTTADIAAGTIQIQANYTDDSGATTQVGAALPLTAIGRDRGMFHIYKASGEITYQTNLVGIIGSSRYSLRARCLLLWRG